MGLEIGMEEIDSARAGQELKKTESAYPARTKECFDAQAAVLLGSAYKSRLSY